MWFCVPATLGTPLRQAAFSSDQTRTPEGLPPELEAAAPEMRCTAPKAPAPKTGRGARRTPEVLLLLARLYIAQLETLAAQQKMDLRGKTVAQIRDALRQTVPAVGT